jgi:hypothetical protein
MLAGNSPYIPSSFYNIATVNAASGGTITFSSIPSTYKSLQIRGFLIDSSSSGLSVRLQLNGDSGTNYARHILRGDGTSAIASGFASASSMNITYNVGPVSTIGTSFICDIIDYASTSKYKTVRNFAGTDVNGTGSEIDLTSGLWQSTAAVNSLSIGLQGAVFTSASSVALYGIN